MNENKITMHNKKKSQFDYRQQMEIKYDHQEIIDVNKIIEKCSDKWFNQTLTKVNGSVVRIGIVEGNIIGTNTMMMMNSFLY
jgi:hypothetical protein